jgi:hypothetical protein
MAFNHGKLLMARPLAIPCTHNNTSLSTNTHCMAKTSVPYKNLCEMRLFFCVAFLGENEKKRRREKKVFDHSPFRAMQ